jgi:hypothetical protein
MPASEQSCENLPEIEFENLCRRLNEDTILFNEHNQKRILQGVAPLNYMEYLEDSSRETDLENRMRDVASRADLKACDIDLEWYRRRSSRRGSIEERIAKYEAEQLSNPSNKRYLVSERNKAEIYDFFMSMAVADNKFMVSLDDLIRWLDNDQDSLRELQTKVTHIRHRVIFNEACGFEAERDFFIAKDPATKKTKTYIRDTAIKRLCIMLDTNKSYFIYKYIESIENK